MVSMPTHPSATPGGVRIATVASAVSPMAIEATLAWPSSTRAHTRPRWRRSMTARIAMLAMLDPKRSPTAMSGAPAWAATTSVASSGSDVARAMINMPTNSRPSPVRSASSSPALARTTPAHTRKPPPVRKTRSASPRVMLTASADLAGEAWAGISR